MGKKTSQEIDMNKFANVQNNTLYWLLLYNQVLNRKYPLLKNFGDTMRLRRSDIQDVMTNSRELFEEGYAIILDDEEFVEHLGLSNIYKYVVKSKKEIDNLLSSSEEQITEFYNNAPRGIKELIFLACIEMIEKGDSAIDSLSKQKFLEKLFGRKLARE